MSRLEQAPLVGNLGVPRPTDWHIGRLSAQHGCEPADNVYPAEIRTTPVSLKSSSVLVLVVLRLQTSAFRPISQIMKRSDRKEAHPPPLIGGEGLIEWLPRFGELLELCCSLRQCVSASVQKFNRVAVAQDFYTTFATQFIRLFLQVCEAGLSVPPHLHPES